MINCNVGECHLHCNNPILFMCTDPLQNEPLKCGSCLKKATFPADKLIYLDDIIKSDSQTVFQNWPLFNDEQLTSEITTHSTIQLTDIRLAQIDDFFNELKEKSFQLIDKLRNEALEKAKNIRMVNENIMNTYNKLSVKEEIKDVITDSSLSLETKNTQLKQIITRIANNQTYYKETLAKSLGNLKEQERSINFERPKQIMAEILTQLNQIDFFMNANQYQRIQANEELNQNNFVNSYENQRNLVNEEQNQKKLVNQEQNQRNLVNAEQNQRTLVNEEQNQKIFVNRNENQRNLVDDQQNQRNSGNDQQNQRILVNDQQNQRILVNDQQNQRILLNDQQNQRILLNNQQNQRILVNDQQNQRILMNDQQYNTPDTIKDDPSSRQNIVMNFIKTNYYNSQQIQIIQDGNGCVITYPNNMNGVSAVSDFVLDRSLAYVIRCTYNRPYYLIEGQTRIGLVPDKLMNKERPNESGDAGFCTWSERDILVKKGEHLSCEKLKKSTCSLEFRVCVGMRQLYYADYPDYHNINAVRENKLVSTQSYRFGVFFANAGSDFSVRIDHVQILKNKNDLTIFI